MNDSNSTDVVLCRKDGPLRWLTVNRPEKRNALSLPVRIRALELLREVAEDSEARVLIVSGAGGTFISGGDISELGAKGSSEETAARFKAQSNELLHSLQTLGKPVIAMIHGYCFGGGMLLAASCDLRLCADDAVFCAPAARLGLAFPLDYAQLVVNLVGLGAAREMMFTARRYSASEAVSIGLVNRVVPKAELEDYTRRYAISIAENAPLSVKAAKIVLAECAKGDSLRDTRRIDDALSACMNSEDLRLGAEAFMQKKKPVFVGR